MELIPLDSNELISVAAGWLSDERVNQWLDFGVDMRPFSPVSLKVMCHRNENVVRLFTGDDGRPIGLIALSQINSRFRTATLWELLGERRYSSKGYAFRAARTMLEHAFDKRGLESVAAWAVDNNHASLRTLRRLGFRLIGRQRRCHMINGEMRDRLLFDLVASEFNGDVEWPEVIS